MGRTSPLGAPSSAVPRIALIGCGAWGKNWARNLHDAGALAVLCDADTDRLSTIAKQYPGAARATSPDAIISSNDVDGFVVATPASTHFSVARFALESGKDVLVEKPLAMRVEEGERLSEIATAKHRILMVGHVLEYHPAIQRLRNLIAEGRLGRINHIYSHRLNLGTFRTEENALWSFAPHDIAVILRLVAKTPESIACHGGSYLNQNIADLTLTSMSFPGGVFSHIFVSWLHPFKEQRLIVVGDRRMAVFDDLQPWERKLVLYEHQVRWKFGHEPVAGPAEAVPELLQPCEPLRAECDAFLESIRARSAPLTDGESGIKVLRVLEAAQESLNRHGQPIGTSQQSDGGTAFIHPTAVIDHGAKIGADTKVWHFTHVMGSSIIGKSCVLGQNVFVGGNVSIGDRVKIQNNVSVYEGVTLEDDVFCGPSAVFTNVKRPRSEISQRGAYARTLVGRGATLGANSTIVCGSTIGKYALIGAGAVVTKSVPDYAVVTGTPGRVVGFACRCGNRLNTGSTTDDRNAQCSSCGRAYRYSARDRTIVEIGRGD